jgi:hypothetical protein
MHVNHLNLIGKQYLINNEGYYFDYILNGIDKKYFTDIEDLKDNEIQIVKYPSYEQLKSNFDKLIKSNAVILLLKTQKKEIELISTYFKRIDLPFNVIPFLDYLDIPNFSLNEIFEQSKTKLFFRIIYVFIKTKHIFNLNPSNFYGINMDNCEEVYSKLDFKDIKEEQFPNAYLYYQKALGHFSVDIFFALLFYDLEKYSDEKIDYILKLIKFEDLSCIDINKLGVSENIIKKYSKEIAWIKKDGSLFMIGAVGC